MFFKLIMIGMIVLVIIVVLTVFVITNKTNFDQYLSKYKYLPYVEQLQHCPFHIDAVITYVDSNDPQWKQEKDFYLNKLHAQAIDNVDRWNDVWGTEQIEEIELCILSILKNLPYVRHIHVVTHRPQKPACFETNPKISRAYHYGRLRLVHHDAFIPLDVLPVFNSNAIECYISKIPGLSEHFLYFNDDCMITQPIPFDRLFDATGKPVLYGKTSFFPKFFPTCRLNSAFYCMRQRARNMESSLLWSFYHWHQFKAYTKRWYDECIVYYKDLLEETSSLTSKFRSPREVEVVKLLSHFGILYGYATVAQNPLSARYINCNKINNVPNVERLFQKYYALCVNNCNNTVNKDIIQQFYSKLKEKFLEEQIKESSQLVIQ